MSTLGLIAERTTLRTPCANRSWETNDHSILFDGLDSLIFPLRMWLVAPPQTRIHLTIHADGGTADPAIAAVMGSTPVFRDDKKMLPLQAADLLAWHLRRRKEPRYANEIRPAIQRIIGNHLEAEITESVLRTLAKGMAATPGINDTQSKKSSIRKLLKTKWEASNKSGENEDENSNDEKK